MRYLFIMLCTWYMLLNPSISYAWTCNTPNSTITLSPTTINIATNTDIDTLIGTRTASSMLNIFDCNSSDGGIKQYRFSFRATGTYVKTIDKRRIYQTNIAGIGYAIGINATGPYGCNISGWIGSMPDNGNSDTGLLCNRQTQSVSSELIFTGQVIIHFYKIAETISSGTINLGNIGEFKLFPNSLPLTPLPATSVVNPFQVVAPSCTLNTTSVTVPMGPVEKRDFKGLGTTVDSKSANFKILMTCPLNITVKLQVDGNILDASKGLLNITPGTTSASGVAIQLLFSGAPLTLSTPVKIGTQLQGNSFIIPLQARYYQSGATITPGDANGTATFTLTYQ